MWRSTSIIAVLVLMSVFVPWGRIAAAHAASATEVRLPRGELITHEWSAKSSIVVLMAGPPSVDGMVQAVSYRIRLNDGRPERIGSMRIFWLASSDFALTTRLSNNGKYVIWQKAAPSGKLDWVVSNSQGNIIDTTELTDQPADEQVAWLADGEHWAEWMEVEQQVIIHSVRHVDQTRTVRIPVPASSDGWRGRARSLIDVSPVGMASFGPFIGTITRILRYAIYLARRTGSLRHINLSSQSGSPI